jgi:hypothetical protein
MPLLDETRAAKLIELARASFDPELSEAEEQVLRQSASSAKPPRPEAQGPRPPIRPEFVRWLATAPDAAALVDPKGIRLYSVTISGDLDLKECRVLARLDVKCCTFEGGIVLRSAETRGIFILGSKISGPIRGDGVNIHGRLFLLRTECAGEIRLLGAQIDGDLDCGAKLTVEGNALSLDGATIGGNVFLNRGFECAGMIRLPGAHIGGDLDCSNSTISAMSCLNMRLEGDLIWVGIRNSEKTWLNLAGATVRNFRDDRASWPGMLVLDGFCYEELTLHRESTPEQIQRRVYAAELPLMADERVAWIKLQPSDRLSEPQPWVHLAKHLEAKGDKTGARHVLYEFACHRANASWLLWRPFAKAFAWLEEQPIRICWSIFTLLMLGSLLFWHASLPSVGAIAPTNRDAYSAWAKGAAYQIAYPRFQPIVYTLENELPLIKLGLDDKWAPDPAHKAAGLVDHYWLLVVCRWLLIALGWVQATALAAAIGGRFKS